MEKSLYRIRLLAKISLVFIFLVIIAGSIVRMTGSGMGCPDWPKCFGYYLPPTEVETLTYRPGKEFQKNQMVIYSDTLWMANNSFAANSDFNHSNWTKYPRHDYATFNASQTWTEYINRLMGALAGIPVLVLFVLSLLFVFKHKSPTFLLFSAGVLFMFGFEAWLGKLVVDKNLQTSTVTLHMLGSMAIVAMLIAIINKSYISQTTKPVDAKLKYAVLFMLLLSVIQIIMGTQVREEIDVIAKQALDRSEWIAKLTSIFPIHRSFSILIGATALFIFIQNRKSGKPLRGVNSIVAIVLLEIMVGIGLNYLRMPFFLQPLHLLLAIGIFAICFDLSMKSDAQGSEQQVAF